MKPGHQRFIALWLVDPNRRIISTANVPPQQRNWWLEGILGSTPEQCRAALSRLPAEIVSLIAIEHLSIHGVTNSTESREGAGSNLPPELMEMVREYYEGDQGALLMGAEEVREHRLKLMQERIAFLRTEEEDWQAHAYYLD